MTRKKVLWGILITALALGMVLAACPTEPEETPVPSGPLDELLREYLVPREEQWDDGKAYIYRLDPLHVAEFKAELEAGGAYTLVEERTQYDRDWDRGLASARWDVRPDGRFELRFDKKDNSTSWYMYKKDPLASGILDASLRRYMGPQEQYWGDDDNRDEEPTYVYYLDPKRFEEFKDELDALDEYYQDDDWTEDDRDWERGQTFARWAERPDGTFQLQLCKSDNTEIGYRYRKVGAFVPVDYISGGWVLEAEIGEPLALNDWHWVRPDNATDKTITWSVKDPGSTGAAITGNILTATALGDAIVTGTVANGKGEGKPYTEDRTVTVKGPIVPHGDFVLRDILGGVELAQYLGNDTEVVIPGDLGITALGPASFQLSAMTSVVVPEGVTEIDQAAFLESYSLTSVTLPQSLRIIREEAFNACPALSSMRVEAGTPPSVADGFLGFQAPANLTAIYVPAASVDAYKAADGWKKHASLITAIVP